MDIILMRAKKAQIWGSSDSRKFNFEDERNSSWSNLSYLNATLLDDEGENDNGTGGLTANFKRDENLAKIEIAVLLFLFVFTVIGNSIVLLGIYLRRQKMTRMYYFILHLSIADLVTAFFNVLAQLIWEITYRFKGGNILCKFVKYTQLLGPYASSYILVMTAIDRYQAICFPLSNCRWTARKSKLMLGIAWTISLLSSVPQIFIFSYQEVNKDPAEFDCWATFPGKWGAKTYVTWYSISVFIIPLIILMFAYICITRAILINFNMKAENRNEDGFECRVAQNNVDDSQRIENQPTFLSQESVFQIDTSRVYPPQNKIVRSSSTVSLDHHQKRCKLSKSSSSSESSNQIPRIERTKSQPVLNIQTTVMSKSRKASLSSASQIESNYTDRKQSESSVRDRKRSESERSTTSSYISSQYPRTHSVSGISRAKIKTIKLTVTVICCYIICSSPFIAAELWSVFDPLANVSPFFTGPTYTILTLLASLNSCANPFIFLVFNPSLLQNCVNGISISLHLKSGSLRAISKTGNRNAKEKRGERKTLGSESRTFSFHMKTGSAKLKENSISNPLRKNSLNNHNMPEIVAELRCATHRPHQRHQHNSIVASRFRGGFLADLSERNESTSSSPMVEIDASALKRRGQCLPKATIAKTEDSLVDGTEKA